MRTVGWLSKPGLGLVMAAAAMLIGMAAGQPARAAAGYWRFTGYDVSPPQSQLDETDRGMRAMGRTSETRVSGAFQPAMSGAGSIDLFLKTDDVDRRVYLTTLKFSFTTGVEMRALTPGRKLHVEGGLVMGGNGLSKALPANGSGKFAVGNGDYVVSLGGAIDQPASGAGDIEIPNGGGPGDTLTLHAEAHLGSYGGLGGKMNLNYEWVAGPAPQPGPGSGGGSSGDGFAGAWNTSEGPMTLGQSGGHVSGTYSQDNGRIDGQVSGGRLTGYWGEDSSAQQCPTQRLGTNYWGRIDWVLSADGRRFEGRWSYCDAEPGASWTGERTGAAAGAASPGGYAEPSGAVPALGRQDGRQDGYGGYGHDNHDDHAQGPAYGHDDHIDRGDRGYPAAAEQLLADVGNTAACGLTDTSALSLSAAAQLTRVDIWYHWGPGERSVGYTLSGGGRTYASGFLSRAECDPYQTAWCVARGAPDVTLAPGRYTLRLDRGGICQNAGSGGAGFIKAWGYRR